MSEQRDYRDTVFLPKTDFPMKAGLPQKEPGILARWQDEGIYQALRKARVGREKFVLHDGPPYANGDMHIGHALNHVLKDMVVRTQSLLGKDAPYVPGWDCHGLPIEWKVEEQYRKKKLDKDQVPADEFRAECRAYAQHWVNTQCEQLKRLGINGDWDNPYLTMDFQAEATIVAELLKFAENGMLYRGAKPVMWSPVEKTALAEAEVEYENITSTQIDVAFEILTSPNAPELQALIDEGNQSGRNKVHAVIWTTTPWTIPVNQAIAYGEDIDYVLVDHFTPKIIPVTERGEDSPLMDPAQSKRILIAANLLPEIRATRMAQGLYRADEIHWRGKGSDLAGTVARHPMAKVFESPLPAREGMGVGVPPPATVEHPHPTLPLKGEGVNRESPLAEFFLRPRPFLPGSFVTTDSGTGLVHMAPDHGEDDFDLCKSAGIEPVFAVEGDGKYRADWAWLGGQGSVINPKFNAPDGPICTALDEAGGLLTASTDYQHSYPHSWRSKAKVIFRCTPQWFVPMDKPMAHLPVVTPAEQRWENEGGDVTIDDSPSAGAPSLREVAMAEIGRVRFVPEKGRNRIGSMVEGRPDWVLSRQRAWGVPITLFVNRKTGQYLVDPAVNARIVAAVREGGVDAWSDANAPALLGPDHDAADYERISDILDVWFDSGCTHVFTLESGRWGELKWPADLYLEGSDQHRGWFQSSLLESCATRGRAPYDAVLTHGFTMDAKGLKMSKSLGNTIDPLKVMETYGADIIRLWALSVDYTEDHRIGDEILKGVSDQYRKLRNTFRYLLGALDGFSEAERVSDVAAMPELERYVLALLARLDAMLRQAVADFDYNTYVRALSDFCNEDLSAFFFDIRKDCLYCDAASDPKRMAYRSVLDTLFHALVRYAAPVLVFTAEEVWGTRFPEAGSVHLLEWPVLPSSCHPGEGRGPSSDGVEGEMDSGLRRNDELVERWSLLRARRTSVSMAIEPLRRDKTIGSSLEAVPCLKLDETDPSAEMLAELFISALPIAGTSDVITVTRTTHHKCGRCWRHLPEVTEDGALCSRCDQVVADMDARA